MVCNGYGSAHQVRSTSRFFFSCGACRWRSTPSNLSQPRLLTPEETEERILMREKQAAWDAANEYDIHG